jgi:hypothetical protein
VTGSYVPILKFCAFHPNALAEAPRSGLEEPAPSLSRGCSSARRSGRRLLEHPSRRETSPRPLRHEGWVRHVSQRSAKRRGDPGVVRRSMFPLDCFVSLAIDASGWTWRTGMAAACALRSLADRRRNCDRPDRRGGDPQLRRFQSRDLKARWVDRDSGIRIAKENEIARSESLHFRSFCVSKSDSFLSSRPHRRGGVGGLARLARPLSRLGSALRATSNSPQSAAMSPPRRQYV